MKTNVILFPNRRESLAATLGHWWALGYQVSNTRRGRMVLVIPRQ